MTDLSKLQEANLIDLSQNQLSACPNRSQTQRQRRHPTKIICFYAEKGGVGKTTTCLTFAHTFAKDGHRVLVYDCNVQRSLTS